MYRKLYRVAIVISVLVFFNFQIALSNEKFELLYDSSRITNSLELAELALKEAETIKNSEFTGKAHFLIAFYHRQQFQYFKAINHYYNALKEYRIAGNVKMQVSCLKSLGIIYSKARFYRRSLEFYNDALALCEITQDQKAKGLLLYELGYIYSSTQQLDSATHYFENAIAILKAHNYYNRISDAFVELGFITATNNADQLAQQYYDSSVQVVPRSSDYYYYALLRKTNSRAYYEIKKGNLEAAKRLLGQGLDSARHSKYKEPIMKDMYWNLANLHKKNRSNVLYISALEKFIDNSNLEDFSVDFHQANFSLLQHYRKVKPEKADKYIELNYKFGHELAILKKQLEDKHVHYQIEAADYRKQLEQKNQQLAEQKQANTITYLIIVVVALVVYIFVSNYLRKIRSEKAKISLEKENIYKNAKEVLTKVHTPSV